MSTKKLLREADALISRLKTIPEIPEDAEPEDKLSITEAAEIIGEMADNHADLSGDDPEDEELWRKAEALTIAYNALQDLIEQGAR